MNNIDKKIALVLAIQELSIRITNNSNADVFCDYSGHTNGLSIRVCLDGWQHDNPKFDFTKIIYLDRNNVKELEEVLGYLKSIKGGKTDEINSI